MADDPVEFGEPQCVLEATEQAIRAARHLTPMDVGALMALRVIAQKIDNMLDEIRGEDEHGEVVTTKRFTLDNVTLPTYLKYCESLGLTPAGRRQLAAGKPKAPTGRTGLGGLRGEVRSITGGVAS